jgi:hypothetical protein
MQEKNQIIFSFLGFTGVSDSIFFYTNVKNAS